MSLEITKKLRAQISEETLKRVRAKREKEACRRLAEINKKRQQSKGSSEQE